MRDRCENRAKPILFIPTWVGLILADLELDKETIAAGILHDVVEDTVMSEEEITEDIRK